MRPVLAARLMFFIFGAFTTARKQTAFLSSGAISGGSTKDIYHPINNPENGDQPDASTIQIHFEAPNVVQIYSASCRIDNHGGSCNCRDALISCDGLRVTKFQFPEPISEDVRAFSAQNNRLSAVPVIRGADKLQELLLSYNGINDTEGLAKQNLSALRHLDLSHNALHNLSIPSANLPLLEQLNVSSNRVEDVSFVANLTTLTVLDLSNNEITGIELHTFEKLKQLRDLLLHHNKIVDVNFLPHLPIQVEKIKLSNNFIEKVNVDISSHAKGYREVKFLEFDSNKITYFNFSASAPEFLRVLNLCNNKISDVRPSYVFREKYMGSILLCNNSLTNIDFVAHANRVTGISLSGNNITHIDGRFFEGHDLRFLYLSNTHIDSIEFVLKIPLITVLDVNNNNITRFPKQMFKINKNIEEVRIRGNPLNSLLCPHWNGVFNTNNSCNVSFRKASENILVLETQHEEINEKLQCMLSTKVGREYLSECE